jgi:hypothetical protein
MQNLQSALPPFRHLAFKKVAGSVSRHSCHVLFAFLSTINETPEFWRACLRPPQQITQLGKIKVMQNIETPIISYHLVTRRLTFMRHPLGLSHSLHKLLCIGSLATKSTAWFSLLTLTHYLILGIYSGVRLLIKCHQGSKTIKSNCRS